MTAAILPFRPVIGPRRPVTFALRMTARLIRNARACPQMGDILWPLAFAWLVERVRLEAK